MGDWRDSNIDIMHPAREYGGEHTFGPMSVR